MFTFGRTLASDGLTIFAPFSLSGYTNTEILMETLFYHKKCFINISLFIALTKHNQTTGHTSGGTESGSDWRYLPDIITNCICLSLNNILHAHTHTHTHTNIYICDRGQPKYSEKNLCQCHFVHQKSQMDWPTHKPWLQQIVTSDFCCALVRKTNVKWPANKPLTFSKKPYKQDLSR